MLGEMSSCTVCPCAVVKAVRAEGLSWIIGIRRAGLGLAGSALSTSEDQIRPFSSD